MFFSAEVFFASDFFADGRLLFLSVPDGVLVGVCAPGGLLFSSKKSRQKLT